MTVLTTYTPTEVTDDDTKDLFHHQISATIATVPPHDNLVILGDLNAVTLPSGIPNDNTERLLSLCAVHGLAVIRSWFRGPDIHQWTWLSHDSTTRKEIDHVITCKADKGLFKSC